MVSKDTLKGYILEEVLAYLIRNTGYELLVDPIQDERELDTRGNGLVVKGRGGVHQADVLGQLRWIPAFTFPIRLFVEAKFRADTTGIDVVRNAVGVLLDINQNNAPTRELVGLYPKYQYVYAVFSTSGFSPDATKMALAHQISLIDLSGSEFNSLKEKIKSTADAICEDDSTNESSNLNDGIVKKVRFALRQQLETWPKEVEPVESETELLIRKLDGVIEEAKSYQELFVAMANGPFMLLLKSDNPEDFLEYVSENPRHKVVIRWEHQDSGKTWRITPVEQIDSRKKYVLSFKLPKILESYIFDIQAKIQERAYETKERFFSDITIYRHVDGRDHLFRLEYDAKETKRLVEEANN